MADEGKPPRKQPSDDAVKTLRHVFERVWPLDRKPIFGGLVRAIDDFDREQRRRRTAPDAGDRPD